MVKRLVFLLVLGSCSYGGAADTPPDLNLRDVKIPVYELAAKEDHIAPAKSVFIGAKLFGGPVEYVLADGEVLRQNVDTIVRDFIAHERHHMMMEDRDFFPAALKGLKPQDWTEIASAVTGHKDPLFSDVTEERFDALRAHILRLEQEAEAERK